jgi:hypothetical protein
MKGTKECLVFHIFEPYQTAEHAVEMLVNGINDKFRITYSQPVSDFSLGKNM